MPIKIDGQRNPAAAVPADINRVSRELEELQREKWNTEVRAGSSSAAPKRVTRKEGQSKFRRGETKAFNLRLPILLAGLLARASKESGLSQNEIVRNALRRDLLRYSAESLDGRGNPRRHRCGPQDGRWVCVCWR